MVETAQASVGVPAQVGTRRVRLSATLFGSVRFKRDDEPLQLPASCSSLLAYLLLEEPHPVHRNRVLATLVGEGDEEQARRRLNTVVWRLRRAVEPAGLPRGSVLVSDGARLAISRLCIPLVDVLEFEKACAHRVLGTDSWEEADADAVSAALDLVGGDLLEGSYDEWVLARRAHLSDLRLGALVRLAHWHRQSGAMEEASHFCELAIEAEPLREDLHRLLMCIYAEAGLPALAERQYHRCRKVLEVELNVAPLPETTMLAAQISGRRQRPDTSGDLDPVLRDLERAQSALADLTQVVDRSIAQIRARTR